MALSMSTFFTCERLLLPNVTMRVKLYRAASEFSLTSLADDADKNFCAVIEKASLFVRKVTVTESVKVSIERALLKSPARYPYVESLCKSFIIQTGQNSFVKESIFGTEPIRRSHCAWLLTKISVARERLILFTTKSTI